MVFKKINDTVKSVSLILLNKLLTLIHIYIIVIFFFLNGGGGFAPTSNYSSVPG